MAEKSDDEITDACEWALEDNYDCCDTWETQCGQNFVLLEGTPADNHMKYCCYCGKTLIETKLPEDKEVANHGKN